ncbi:acyltransferase [Duganella caerulea]|uniref:acyltransferase family protein n=1 Tax=Duganella caerulea TaxID=2885762 RepID=UPI0030E98F3B
MAPLEPGRYRADIDGLRALAVLAVMAFHLSPAALPGGFAGVDVFFVISGFLITGVITQALQRGEFSLARFYQRRIVRILPAYALVSAVTLAAASYLMTPNDYLFYTTSLATSWGFVSNLFFSMLSWGYFGQRTEEFPLLHTWSLGVEEQFYFLYPLLLPWLWRRAPRLLVPLLALLAALGLALSEWRTGVVGSYFLLPYRAHELLAGALTAWLVARAAPPSRARATLCALGGAALALGAALWLNRGTPFPGLRSLYPCLGAALLLYAGARDNPVSALLRHRWLVRIGLMSYSLYLWHWPVLSFLRYRRVELSGASAVAAVAAMFALAWLSWRYVELPARRRPAPFRRGLLRYYAAPAAVFLLVGLVSYGTEGLPQRFSADARELLSSYSFERDLGGDCAQRAGEYHGVSLAHLERRCAFGADGAAAPSVLLYGDSHAHHFKPFVDLLARRAALRAVYFVEGSCDPLDLPPAPPAPASGCQRRNADLLRLAPRFRYVVVAGRWQYKGEEALFAARLRTVARQVTAAGATLVVFKDNPSVQRDLSRCVLFRKRGWIPAGSDCDMSAAEVRDEQGSMDGVIDALQAQQPALQVIDPKRASCDAVRCLTAIGNTALYKDANHLNTRAAALLGMRYMTMVGNPLAPAITHAGAAAPASP